MLDNNKSNTKRKDELSWLHIPTLFNKSHKLRDFIPNNLIKPPFSMFQTTTMEADELKGLQRKLANSITHMRPLDEIRLLLAQGARINLPITEGKQGRSKINAFRINKSKTG